MSNSYETVGIARTRVTETDRNKNKKVTVTANMDYQ